MKFTHRPYAEAGADFARLTGFVQAHGPAVRRLSTWCLGRLVDWRYMIFSHKLPIEAFCDANAELWFDGFGALAGFAISENGDENIALLTTEGYQFLYAEMLDWVLQAWSCKGPCFAVEITANHAPGIAALERAGFARSETFFTYTYDLRKPLLPRVELPEGFSIVDMASTPDYRAQRLMRAEGFRGRSDLTEEEIARDLAAQAGYHANPIYHAPTDLCVRAPDGAFVSGCEALIDAHNAEADVERVCTHSAYRRRGFARAVIQECLYRLQAMGLARASITGYSPWAISLYASFGGGEESTSYIYTRAPSTSRT